MAGDERPGHQRASELLEHEHGFRHTELEPAVGLGQPQGEHAGLAQLLPPGAVETTAAVFDAPHEVDREAAVDERAHAFLEVDLVGGELEVHWCVLAIPGQAEDALGDDVALHL